MSEPRPSIKEMLDMCANRADRLHRYVPLTTPEVVAIVSSYDWVIQETYLDTKKGSTYSEASIGPEVAGIIAQLQMFQGLTQDRYHTIEMTLNGEIINTKEEAALHILLLK